MITQVQKTAGKPMASMTIEQVSIVNRCSVKGLDVIVADNKTTPASFVIYVLNRSDEIEPS